MQLKAEMCIFRTIGFPVCIQFALANILQILHYLHQLSILIIALNGNKSTPMQPKREKLFGLTDTTVLSTRSSELGFGFLRPVKI